MKEVYVHPGRYAKVDDEDFEWASRYRWYLSTKGYAIRNITKNGKNTTKRMHRELMGEPKGFQVDHINRDRLDNRRENLRAVTNGVNRVNAKINKNNTSGYRNIRHIPDSTRRRGGYTVYMTRDGVRYSKFFKELKDALLQRREWGIK